MQQTEMKTIQNYIGGEWVDSTSQQSEKVYNPATGEVIARVPISTRADLDRAVQVASKAFETWKEVDDPEWARMLFKYHQLLVEDWDEVAELITIEDGIIFSVDYGEVQRGIEFGEFDAGAVTLMMGEQL